MAHSSRERPPTPSPFVILDDRPPLACDLTVFAPAERARHRALVRDVVHGRCAERRELADGYALRYSADPTVFTALAEWIDLERRCCPFLRFALEVEPGGGPVWVRLTGGAGVKQVLAAAFESVLTDRGTAAAAAGAATAPGVTRPPPGS